MLQQQSTVPSSSTHARCISTAGASEGLILLHCLLYELCENVLNLKPLHIDNRASDLLAQNPVNHAAMKCIDVCYHFICKYKSINLKLIGMNHMGADLLTKSLVHVKHEHFCQMLGMETVE